MNGGKSMAKEVKILWFPYKQKVVDDDQLRTVEGIQIVRDAESELTDLLNAGWVIVGSDGAAAAHADPRGLMVEFYSMMVLQRG
jgi:hypothetical protein